MMVGIKLKNASLNKPLVESIPKIWLERLSAKVLLA